MPLPPKPLEEPEEPLMPQTDPFTYNVPRKMTDAERFIKAGIPLVVSIHFDSSELDGAGYSTDGHLMVIRGFAANNSRTSTRLWAA